MGGASRGERDGFGGKFRRAYRKFYVNYYPEDHTTARDQIEATINGRIEALAQKMSPARVL